MNRRLIHLDLFGYTPFAKLHIATREHFLRWFLTTDDNGVGYADPYRLKGELYLREHITIEEIARRHAELSPEIITTYAARDDDPFYAGILFSHIDLYNPDLPWRQNQPKSDRKKRIIGPTPDEAQPPKVDLFTVDSNWNPTGIQLESLKIKIS